MRVLHIGNEMTWRGGENQIRLLAEGLRPLGIESVIAYPRGSEGLGRFSQDFSTVELPQRSPYSPATIMRVVRAVDTFGINIIDAHSSGAHSAALFVKRFRPNLRLVVHRRVDNPIGGSWFNRRKYVDSRVDRFVAISSAIGQILRNVGVVPQKISVVKSAVDPQKYLAIDREQVRADWRSRFQMGPESVLIGNASALTSQKGYPVLLRAVQRLRSDGADVHCAVAGDGVLKEELMALSQELQISDRVHFLGFIKEVPELLSALDILCVPSENEGLGTVILDGILAGACVAATRVGGIPEMVKDGETGFLVERGDDQALARALKTLVRDRGLRQKLNSAAKQLIANEFSLDSMVGGNLQVYREVSLRGPSFQPDNFA